MYTCPVCAYPKLAYTARDFTICPSCGTEFGYHDANRTFEDLRVAWMNEGMHWHSRVIPQPPNWSAVAQLFSGGYLPVVNRPGNNSSQVEKNLYQQGPVRLQLSWA